MLLPGRKTQEAPCAAAQAAHDLAPSPPMFEIGGRSLCVVRRAAKLIRPRGDRANSVVLGRKGQIAAQIFFGADQGMRRARIVEVLVLDEREVVAVHPAVERELLAVLRKA